MSEHIEREKTIDYLMEIIDRPNHPEWLWTDEICGLLKTIPTADVRPVRRAKWIEDWETGCSECSACHDTFLWEDYKGVAEWNFCPNCGAYMEKS